MTLLFERESWRGKQGPFTLSQVISDVIDQADYDGGALERANNRLDKLIEVVGHLANCLPLGQQERLVDDISYGFTRYKGDRK